MKRTFLLVALGCSSPASTNEAPAPTQPTGSQQAKASPVPHKPVPAGDGVEILVRKTNHAANLVVTDDFLYWLDGDIGHQDIWTAPHRRDAEPWLVVDAPENAGDLMQLGDRLVFSHSLWSIATIPLAGGLETRPKPTELVKLDDGRGHQWSPWHMIDHDGLVVAAESFDPQSVRVFRVSKAGEITDLVKLPGGKAPQIAFDAKDDLYVATNDLTGGFSPEVKSVFGRVVAGKVVPIAKPPDLVDLIATDADSVYYVTNNDHVMTLYRLPSGASKPQRVAGGSITALAVDDRNVYWGEASTTGKLWRLPKTGGQPQAIAEGGSISELVLYGPDIYWIDRQLNQIARVRR